MKKYFVFLFIIVALIVVILSCKKNQSELTSNPDSSVQMSQNDISMEQRILTFNSFIRSNLKGGSSYPIDTAVRYIEGLINYNYGDVNNPLEGHYTFSVFLEVDLLNGQVTPAEAASVYDEIIDSLTVQYETLPSQNGHMIYADVFRRDSTSGSVTFGVISSFCCGSAITEPDWDEEIDYWYYGNGWCNAGGYCDGPYEGTHTDDDAAEQIERKIRVHIGNHQGRYYLGDILTLFILGDGSIEDSESNVYDICDNFRVPYDPLDNYYDYFIMFQGDYDQNTPLHDCLCPDEMSFYYNGTRNVLYNLIYDCPSTEAVLDGKEFSDLNMIGQSLSDSYHTYYVHYIEIGYGVWYLSQDPPDSF